MEGLSGPDPGILQGIPEDAETFYLAPVQTARAWVRPAGKGGRRVTHGSGIRSRGEADPDHSPLTTSPGPASQPAASPRRSPSVAISLRVSARARTAPSPRSARKI